MAVVDLFRCKGCGAPGTRRTLCYQGESLAHFVSCDACVAVMDAVLKRVRPVFDALIAVGVDRDLANATMTFLLDRLDA
jgi:hypothetical protein